jgi:hypothetical protein|tara:strand:+ start:1105 stop:1242 length:138 start_codon:yes stop_codon:yes gene_type:complete
MTKSKIKFIIKKITTWIFYIFAAYFLFQVLKLIYVLIFEGGKNPL